MFIAQVLTPETVSTVRKAAKHLCEQAGVNPDRADGFTVVISELIGNAVRYGSQPIVCFLCVDELEMYVSVKDNNPATPGKATCSPEDAESGRGLFLVDQLSSEWGWGHIGDGKHVWARI